MLESEKQLGKVGFDDETGKYWGEVLHLCATEIFHADSVDELRQLLRESVPNQQEESSPTAVPPTDLLFESVVLDLNPTLLYKLNQQAMLHSQSLNQYIVDILKEVMDESQFLEPA